MYSKCYEVNPSLVINMICMCHNIKLLINGLAKESGWIKNPNHLSFDITNVEQLHFLSNNHFEPIYLLSRIINSKPEVNVSSQTSQSNAYHLLANSRFPSCNSPFVNWVKSEPTIKIAQRPAAK